MKYSLKIGIRKVVEAFIEFGLPFLVIAVSNIELSDGSVLGGLTIGAILRGIVNFIKVKIKKTE